MKLIVILLTALMLLIASHTTDPIAEAWRCRCDTCCQLLDTFEEGLR